MIIDQNRLIFKHKVGGMAMISYENLWKTMNKKGITQYV